MKKKIIKIIHANVDLGDNGGIYVNSNAYDQILDLILKSLPEEQILHSYAEETFKGQPSKFWEGFNEYRNQVMQILNK